MEIEFDRMELGNYPPSVDNGMLSSEHQYSKPTASTDGISFPSVPKVPHFLVAVTATMIALGTAPTGSLAIDLTKFQGLRIVLPSASQADAKTAAERYVILKQEIISAGVPLLTDEELREEIRSRKGLKTEPQN